MSLVVGFEDIQPHQVRRGGGGSMSRTSMSFFRATSDAPVAPSAYLVRYDPGHVSSAHFHEVDQFQILVDGSGRFGHHDVTPYSVHFSRAYTAYGPLQSDKEKGWTFMTLRTRYDPGAQRFPGAQEKLKQIPNRRPWQITKKAEFPVSGPAVSMQEISEVSDDQGLFARTLTMAPNARASAPDPAAGDGQFVVVVKGSLMYERKEHKALTVAFVRPDEGTFQLQAGAQGMEGLILNFPKVMPRAAESRQNATAAGFKRWQCLLCAFVYDEAMGMPEEGIAPGTRWEDVPESWTCPDCSANKSDFEMVEV